MIFLCFCGALYSQNRGDYRSRRNGDWSSRYTWQIYNGWNWTYLGNYDDLPGENAEAGTVTIRRGHTVTISSSPSYSVEAIVIENTNSTNTSTLTVQTGVELSVKNDFSVSGSWNQKSALINNGTIIIGGAATFPRNYTSYSVGSSSTFEFNGSDQTIPYIQNAKYVNLTLSGSGTKTIENYITVNNGVLSMEGTAVATGATPNYEGGAALQYKGSGAQFSGSELPSTWNRSGGLIIDNSDGVTFTSNVEVQNVSFVIKDDAVFNTGTSTVTIGGTPSLGNNGTINVSDGGTFIINANSITSTSNSNTFDFNIDGNLTINANPTISNSVNMYVSSDGVVNAQTLTLNGPKMNIVNDGEFNAATLQFNQSGSVITFENNNTMAITNTLNITQGTAQFKNIGNLTVGQNYNSSSTSTYINCGTYNGKFNLNSGGLVINTGEFTTTQIDFGSSASRIENYGYFYSNGSINPSSGTIYNEGVFSFMSGGFGGDADLIGPSASGSQGYFSWSGRATMNHGTIGPNLNFHNTSGTSSVSAMFNSVSGLTFETGITWGDNEPATLPPVACPSADGTPSIPDVYEDTVCVGADLTALEPTLGGVYYEWWTGTETTRDAQITESTSPSVTNYTDDGIVYLWAKNVSSGVYSNEGAYVLVATIPEAPSITSPANNETNVCYNGTASVDTIWWNAVDYAAAYDVYFGAGSLPTSITATVSTNCYITGQLLKGTTYYWKIVPHNTCGTTVSSPVWTFTTSNTSCATYCESKGNGTNWYYISNVNLETIDQSSSWSYSGYSDNTSVSTDLTVGELYSLSVAYSVWNHGYVCAWIDWNQDGDFEDIGEEYELGQGSGGTFEKAITVPSDAAINQTRMRVSVRNNQYPEPCDVSFYGEVEDYTINVVPAIEITTGTISGSPFCAGESVSVPFAVTETLNAGNVYSAQLSDAWGSFDSPVVIGTLTSVASSGTISGTIPTDAIAGTAYRIRVVASSPSIIGADNGVDITINALPIVSSQPTSVSVKDTEAAAFTVVVDDASSFQWEYSDDDGVTWTSVVPGAVYSITTGTASSVLYVNDVKGLNSNMYRCVLTNSCGSIISNDATLYVDVDSDGDGLYDSEDLDDDNDGILDVEELSPCNTSATSTGKILLKEDFGTGNRTSTTRTDYCFEDGSSSCSGAYYTHDVNDGEYTIVQYSRPYNVNTGSADHSAWITIGDHTGNTNGRMAVFNAATDPGEFYRDTIDITPSLPIMVSFYVINLMSSSAGSATKPDIYVKLETVSGDIIASSTGEVDQDEQWHEFVFTSTCGNNTKAIFVLSNNQNGGEGNDLAIDDIVVRVGTDCDTDGDGIPNRIDIDSDNDGCVDAIEAYADLTVDEDGNGVYGSGTTVVDANGKVVVSSGVPDYAPSSYFLALQADTSICLAENEVQTDSVTKIGETTATLYGHVVEGENIVEYGFYYSTSNVESNLINGGAEEVVVSSGASADVVDLDFTADVSLLINRSAYYFRAYIKDNAGNYYYGEIKRFITERRDFSLALDGDGDALIIDSISAMKYINDWGTSDNTFSVDFWMKQTVMHSGEKEIIVDNRSGATGYWVAVNTEGVIVLAGSPTDKVKSKTVVSDTQWHHIACVYDGDSVFVYVDGRKDSVAEANIVMPMLPNSLIGGRVMNDGTLGEEYEGYLDAMRFWNVALTAEQIQELMYDNVCEGTTSNTVQGNASGNVIPGLNWKNLKASFGFNVKSTQEGEKAYSSDLNYVSQDSCLDYPFFHNDANLSEDEQSFNVIAVGDAKPSPYLPRVNWRYNATDSVWTTSENWGAYAYPGEGVVSVDYPDVSDTDIINDSVYCKYTIINASTVRPVVTVTPPDVQELVDREENPGTYSVSDDSAVTLTVLQKIIRALFSDRVDADASSIEIESGSVEVFE